MDVIWEICNWSLCFCIVPLPQQGPDKQRQGLKLSHLSFSKNPTAPICVMYGTGFHPQWLPVPIRGGAIPKAHIFVITFLV